MSTGSRVKRTQSLIDPAEYEDVVPKVEMLQEMSEETRTSVCQLMLQISKAYELSPGEVLYERGQEDENTGALLVIGRMRVKRKGGTPIYVMAPELLGEMRQISSSGTRTATVVAEEDCTVLEFSWSDFDYMAAELGAIKQEQYQEFQRVLGRWSTKRQAELDETTSD